MKIEAGQNLIDYVRGKKAFPFGAWCAFFRNLKCYLYNYWITYFPSYHVRHWYLKHVLGIKIGKGSFVHLGCYFLPTKVVIGSDTVIGRNVDIIGEVVIGDHCSITSHSVLQSASHHKNSLTFAGFVHSIIIEDYVWIGNMSVVLPGVVIKRGAIVGAHSTVCKNIENFEIVAGCPSKVLGKRDEQICRYVLSYRPPFN